MRSGAIEPRRQQLDIVVIIELDVAGDALIVSHRGLQFVLRNSGTLIVITPPLYGS